MQERTICAIATPKGRGGIGIIRLSGERALAVGDAVFRAASGAHLADTPGGRALYGHVVTGDGEVVDEAMALVFRAPHSYTAEDVVELQCHGSQAVLRRVLSLAVDAGAALAERGEFTKRAFLNGRVDLSEAEAVMSIVSARTDAALKLATGHLTGRFSALIRSMRDDILAELAHIEAAIDFPEDEIDDVLIESIKSRVDVLRENIQRILSTAHAGRILTEGLTTAIIGRPNVGKSSLLNALLREERAIVTDIPGTTRDAIEETAEVGGAALRIIDTAGIRESDDAVERIGIERARTAAEGAELVLALFDASRPLSAEDEEILALLRGRESGVVLLRTKTDLAPAWEAAELAHRAPGARVLSLSTKTGAGMAELEQAISALVYADASPGEESSFVSTEREASLLREADEHLAAAERTIEEGMSVDFISIDLRSAWEALGRLTGEDLGENLIDEIFSRFCLGK